MIQGTWFILIYIIIVGFVNVYFSYTIGNHGLEAFLTAFLGLLVLFQLQIVKLISLLVQRFGRLAGIAGLVLLTVIWLFVVFASIGFLAVYLPTILDNINGAVNWILVVAGTLPYALTRFFGTIKPTVQAISINLLVTVYSIMASLAVLAIATGEDYTHSFVLLVLTVELQVMLSFIFSNTNYVEHIIKLSGHISKNISPSNDLQHYLVLLFLGIPLTMPLAAQLIIITL